MAKSLLNSGLEQVRGTLDQWVYKVVRGKRIIARRPRLDPNRRPSSGELAMRQGFRDAIIYGRSVMADPPRKVLYGIAARVSNRPIFSVIIQDFFTKPEVNAIETAGYHGHAGDVIVVRASDRSNVAVRGVKVVLRNNTTQAVIESGLATLTGQDWVYTATTALPVGQSVAIEATVTDQPGNEATLSKVYP